MRRAFFMLSVLSRHANGRYTGTSAAWSMAKRFLVVWLATWPMLSPVTIPCACSSLATNAAILYIIRLQSTQVVRGAKLLNCSKLAPWFTIPRSKGRPAHTASALTTDSARSRPPSPVKGTQSKNSGMMVQPRFIISHAATGESIPPERSAITFP